VKDFSVGNSIIDSLLGAQGKQGIQDTIQNTLSQLGISINSLEFNQGSLQVTYTQTTVTPDTNTVTVTSTP
jgi:hypothetical protein